MAGRTVNTTQQQQATVAQTRAAYASAASSTQASTTASGTATDEATVKTTGTTNQTTTQHNATKNSTGNHNNLPQTNETVTPALTISGVLLALLGISAVRFNGRSRYQRRH